MLILAVVALETFSTYTVSKSINQNAPVKTKQTITIVAPVEKVYAVFSDIDNWKSWQKDITSSKLNGPFQSGTTYDWKTGGLFIHSTLHTVEPFKAVGWSGKAFGAFAIHNWTFTTQNGYTTVTVEESMEGWLVSLMKNKFQSGLGPATLRWLMYLKLESEK